MYLIRILLFIVFTCNYSYAAHLHAIIVCDTHAVDLEDSVKLDCKHIQRELHKIACMTGLKLSLQLIKGEKVDARVMNKIKRPETKQDDVVIFYYSGHGTRFKGQNDPWPYFDFEYDDPKSLSLLDVTRELMKKKARLVLSIADCCNDYQGTGDEKFVAKGVNFELVEKGYDRRESQSYRKLFLEEKGTYIATSALPGEISISYDEDDEECHIKGGSIFTNALLKTIHNEAQGCHELSWDIIFHLAALKAIEYQLRDDDDKTIYHHPQFQRLDH